MIVNPKNFKHVKSQTKEEINKEEQFPMEVLHDWFLSGLKCDNCNGFEYFERKHTFQTF